MGSSRWLAKVYITLQRSGEPDGTSETNNSTVALLFHSEIYFPKLPSHSGQVSGKERERGLTNSGLFLGGAVGT